MRQLTQVLILSIGVAIGSVFTALTLPEPVEVVCESGTEIEGKGDYVLWVADCKVNDIQGKSVTVTMID